MGDIVLIQVKRGSETVCGDQEYGSDLEKID
jgi:hypothetical protein